MASCFLEKNWLQGGDQLLPAHQLSAHAAAGDAHALPTSQSDSQLPSPLGKRGAAAYSAWPKNREDAWRRSSLFDRLTLSPRQSPLIDQSHHKTGPRTEE